MLNVRIARVRAAKYWFAPASVQETRKGKLAAASRYLLRQATAPARSAERPSKPPAEPAFLAVRPRLRSSRLYWFAILPFHGINFNGMANRIVLEAEGGRQAHTSPTERRSAWSR